MSTRVTAMRICIISASFLFLLGQTQSSDQAQIAVKKAIAAHGFEVLKKKPAFVEEHKGQIFINGSVKPLRGKLSWFGPEKTRMEFNDDGTTSVEIIHRGIAWSKEGDKVEKMGEEEATEAREGNYITSLTLLAPLLKSDLKISVSGEKVVKGSECLVVKAIKQGHREVSLYFDKKTGLLKKYDWVYKRVNGMLQECETFILEHENVEGVKWIKKTETFRAGERVLILERSSIRFLPSIDEKLFAKP